MTKFEPTHRLLVDGKEIPVLAEDIESHDEETGITSITGWSLSTAEEWENMESPAYSLVFDTANDSSDLPEGTLCCYGGRVRGSLQCQ